MYVSGAYFVCISHLIGREVALWAIIGAYIVFISRGADRQVTLLCFIGAHISSVFHV